MAKNTGQVTFDIQFISKGLNNIEGSVVGLTKNIEATKKAAASIFGGTSTTFTKYESQLNNLLQKANKAFTTIQKLKEDAFSDDLGSDELEKLSRQFQKVASNLGGITNTLSGTKQAINGSVKGVTENIKNLLTNLRAIGASSDTLTTLYQKFNKAQSAMTRTGDSKFLFQFNKELEKSTQNAYKLEDAIKKMSALQISSPQKAPTINKLEDLKTKALTGEASPQQIAGALRQADNITASLLIKQKDLLKTQKDSKSTLDSSIKNLISQKDYLEKTRASQTGIASSTDLQNADKQIAILDAKIKKLQILEATNLRALSPSAVESYAKAVEKSTANVDALSKATNTIGGEVKLSKNFENAKTAAAALNKEVAQLKTILTQTSKAALGEVEAKITSIQSKLNTKGGIQPKVAKDELNDLNKKIELLKKISDFETKVTNAEASKSLTSSEALQMLKDVEAFRNEVVKASGSVGILNDKMKTFYSQLGSKVASDKGFDKIIISYNEQIKSLERLINAKNKWASSSDISKAKAEVENLKQKVKEATAAKEQFNVAFSAAGGDPSAAVRNASSRVEILNNELKEAKSRARDAAAELTKVSSIKWFVNIAQRASAYMGLYQGMTGIIGLVTKGTQYVLEFDQAAHTLSAVLDMSADSAKRLEDRLAGLSVRFGGSLKDINEAALALGRAGFDKSEIASATENIIKMARLTGDTFATSASALITYREVFGDVEDAVTGVTPSVEDLADKLAYVANQSRLSTQDIGTFSNYALAAAKSSGMTANSVSAMAIAFSNAGVNASTIGTQIRRFSNVLSETSSEVRSFFMQMGMDQEMMMGRMKMGTEESNKVMAEFVTKLKNMSASEFSRITRGMDILALQSVTLLRNNADEFFAHLQKLNAGVQGEVNKANYVTESYAITWEKLGNSLGVAFNKSVGNLLPVIKNVTDGAIVMIDSLSRKFMAISENWDTFKVKFTQAMGLMGSVVATFAVSSLSMMIGGFASLVGQVGLVTAALQKMSAVVGVIGRHPLVLLLTLIGGAAYYAVSGMTAAAQASKNLSQVESLNRANDRVRDLQQKYNESGKAEDYEKLLAAQQLVGKLTNDLNLAATVLDAESAINQAKAKASAYTSLASKANSPEMEELVKVAGAQTQVSITQAIEGVKAVAETALKTLPASEKERAKELSEFLALLGRDLKNVAKANFEDGSNVQEMDKWTQYLENLGEEAKKVGVAFGDTAKVLEQTKYTISSSVQPGAYNPSDLKSNKKELQRIALEKGVNLGKNFAVSDGNGSTSKDFVVNENIRDMSLLLAKIENLMGKNLEVSSFLRTKEENDKIPGASKTSQHLTGAAIDVLVGSEEEALKLVGTMEQYQTSLKGLGQVIMESKTAADGTVKYWVHIGKGNTPSFSRGEVTGQSASYTPMNFSAPSSQGPALSSKTSGVYDVGTATQTVKVISEEEIAGLKKIAESLQTQYASHKDVTTLTQATVDRLGIAIERVKEQQAFMIKSAVDSAPEIGKQMLQEFATDFVKITDPVKADMAIMDFSKKVKGQEEAQMAGVSDPAKLQAIQSAYGSMVESVKKFAEGSKQILELETQRVKLADMGRAKLAEETDLHKESEDRARSLKALNAEALLAQEKFNAVSENRVRVVTEASLLETHLQDLKKKEVEAENYYLGLLREREEITRRIKEYNASGTKDKTLEASLEKQSQDINTKISEQYKLQTNTMKDVVATENKLLGLKTSELSAVREIQAEYLNYVNRTSGYQKDLDVLRQIQEILQKGGTGINEQRAKEMVSGKLGVDIEDKSDAITQGNYFSQGMSNSSNVGIKNVNRGINKQFDSYDADINAKRSVDLQLQQEYMRELEARGAEMSYAQQEEYGAKIAELNIKLVDAEVALVESGERRKEAIRGAYYGMMAQNTKESFDAMANIAQAYYTVTGKKSKAAFKVMQGLQVASAIMSTYQNAVLAYQRGLEMPLIGSAMAPVLAAGAIAQGMMQVSQIKAQTFHTGGYVSDDNRAGLRSDEIPAVLQTGEYVLSRNDLKAIKETSGISQSAQASPQKSEVVIVNSLDPTVIEQYLTSRAGRQVINNAIKR